MAGQSDKSARRLRSRGGPEASFRCPRCGLSALASRSEGSAVELRQMLRGLLVQHLVGVHQIAQADAEAIAELTVG